MSGLNNSLHGLLWNKDLTVLSQTATATSASVELGYTFNAEQAGGRGRGREEGEDTYYREVGYPFRLTVKIRYTLDAAGFWVDVDATNDDPNGWPLPFFNGWHPYFLVSTGGNSMTSGGCGSGGSSGDVGSSGSGGGGGGGVTRISISHLPTHAHTHTLKHLRTQLPPHPPHPPHHPFSSSRQRSTLRHSASTRAAPRGTT